MTDQELNEIRMIIAAILKKRRIELGITHEQLAENTGLGIATIKRMEDARFWPALKQYVIVCKALDLFPSIEKLKGRSIVDALKSLK